MFRTTNPVRSATVNTGFRVRYDRIAASVVVGAVLGGLGMYTFVIASDKAPQTPQESPEVSVVQEDVSSRENGAQADLEALSTAVADLRNAAEAGGDLTPYLVRLAEVDNEIRFGS